MNAPCVRRIVKGAGRHRLVKAQHGVNVQWSIGDLLGDLHRSEVVDDHLLASSTWRPSCLQQFLRYTPRGAGALELAGGNRLLNERTHEVAVARSKVRHDLVRKDLPAGLLVDQVNQLLHCIDVAEPEGATVGPDQRKLARHAPACEGGRQPPPLMREPLRRLPVKHLIPV